MHVLIFANPKDAAKARFREKISNAPVFSPTFVCERGRFKSLLMQKTVDWGVIVFFAYDQDDLTFALSLKTYLLRSKVVLVLYKVDKSTLKQGLSISPCFITHADSDFNDLIAIMENMSV